MSCRSNRFPCCLSTRCVCPPGPAGPQGPPGSLDWGVAAIAETRNAVVGIVSRDGSRELGSGFWVSGALIATAWLPLSRESRGVRVIVQLEAGPPLALDGVVSFAVPNWDIAYVTVNPWLYSGTAFTPKVLNVATDVAAGETVFTIANARTADVSNFNSGAVVEASFGHLGYVAEVVVSVIPFPLLPGAPVIRRSDYAIVGMLQYGSVNSAGVTGNLLAAANQWASETSNPSPIVSARFLPGVVTIPVLRGTPALGVRVPSRARDILPSLGVPATALDIPLPMVTEAVNPNTSPLGAPCTGAWVVDPVMTLDEDPFGNYDGNWLFGTATDPTGQQVTYGDLTTGPIQWAAGFVRHTPSTTPFVDISATGTKLNDDPAFNSATGVVDLSAIATDPISPGSFRISAQPLAAGTCTPHTATTVLVSALGLVGFESAAFPLALVDMDPASLSLLFDGSGFAGPSLYATPFGSSEFQLPGATPDYTLNAGDAGAGLAVYHELFSTLSLDYHVLQWTGFAQSTGDPVSFQLWLGVDTTDPQSTSTTSGQVWFVYGTLPGTWAGAPWDASTRLTSDPVAETTQVLRVVNMPVINEAIYFGNASFKSNVYQPATPASTAVPQANKFSALTPVRDPDGALDADNKAQGTVAQANDGSPTTWQYALAKYTWPETYLRVGKVQALDVGASDLNDLALVTALVRTRATATASNPYDATVSLISVGQGSATAMDQNAIQLFLASARWWGNSAGGSIVNTTSNTLTFTPSTVDNPYTSALLTVPLSGTQQPNLVSVTVDLSIPVATFPENGLVIVEIMSTNSTSANSQFAPSIYETCVVVWNEDGANYRVQTRAGYGGAVITTSVATPIVGPAVTVSEVLTYGFSANVVQRVNALVVGRPPRAGNQPAFDPTSGDAILSPVAMALSTSTPPVTAPLVDVLGVDGTRNYAITSRFLTAPPPRLETL